MAEKNSFRGYLYVTIDTEMDADIHWKKKIPPQFSSVLEGIPKILRPIWDQYKINPIYFVSPEVAGDEACCRVLRSEIEKGAVIGAHLHPEYIEPCKKAMGKNTVECFPCMAYAGEIEKEKIRNLSRLIRDRLGVSVQWYRAARFGADADTIRILEELGFAYDSSFTPGINWGLMGGPDHTNTPLDSYYVDRRDIYARNRTGSGIKEYPVTIMGKRFGVFGRLLPDSWIWYRWLRPSHMTFMEQRRMVKKLRKDGIRDIVMMFHSMEVMVGKTPYVRTKWMQRYFIWRLRKTVAYARKNGYRSYRGKAGLDQKISG